MIVIEGTDLERIDLDKLIEDTLYDIRIHVDRAEIVLCLPYRGKDRVGRLIFGDGPNGVWIQPDNDLIKVFYDHLPF